MNQSSKNPEKLADLIVYISKWILMSRGCCPDKGVHEVVNDPEWGSVPESSITPQLMPSTNW